MRFQILFLGALLCFGATASGQTTSASAKPMPGANRMKPQPATTAEQSVTGCVDERNGHYVLRDVQTSQLISLQAPGSNDDSYFAKFLGHQAQASGAKSNDTLKVSHISQVADMCGTGK
jgi:hypothetical protein